MSGQWSDEQVDRNLEGIGAEKDGDVNRATRLYEKNVVEGTDTPYPYERLSLIYYRQGKYREALRVIHLFFEHAVQNPHVVSTMQERRDRILKKIATKGEAPMQFPDRSAETQIHREAARNYRSQGDYSMARAAFLKWVESVRQQNINTGGELDQDLKDARAEYSDFARTDPLYKEIRAAAIAVIKEQHAVLQTSLYEALPQYEKPDIQYAMYFAGDHGAVVRTKKGRTYSLTLP